MNWSDELCLLSETEKFDAYNKPYYEYSEDPVFCNRLPVKRTEFYQAQTVGYKVEKVFEVKLIDFDEDKHTHVKYKNKIYRILRAYEKGSENIELTCIGNIHNGQ